MKTGHGGYTADLIRRVVRVACPSCGAGPFQPCASKKLSLLSLPHKERVRRFKTLARERRAN